jgi:hypothetical protein
MVQAPLALLGALFTAPAGHPHKVAGILGRNTFGAVTGADGALFGQPKANRYRDRLSGSQTQRSHQVDTYH